MDEFGDVGIFDVVGFVAPSLQVIAFFFKANLATADSVCEVLALAVAIEDVKGLLFVEVVIDDDAPCFVRLADLLHEGLLFFWVEVSAF